MDELDQIEARLTAAMREADATHERVGGGTRHYVRDCLLPILSRHGIGVVLIVASEEPGERA